MNEQGIVAAIIQQVPALAVLTWIVYRFLAHLQSVGSEQTKRESERSTALQHLGDECHEFQEKLFTRVLACLDKTQVALDRNIEMLGRLSAELARVSKS